MVWFCMLCRGWWLVLEFGVFDWVESVTGRGMVVVSDVVWVGDRFDEWCFGG